jgi:AcrR family transcriptional regulator
VGDGPRTRGGWTPVGTAAERREVHAERGSERGERTRRKIVDAARTVFERDGYLDVGVDDIVREAGVARGSFYTYFPSKIDVFRVITGEVASTVDRSVLHRREEDRDLDPVEALQQANERYVEVYRQNARMYGLIEQLGQVDDDLHAGMLARRQGHIDRIASLITRWQTQGVADPSIQAAPIAAALLAMVLNHCYWSFAGGPKEADPQEVASAINEIWIRTVDLRRRPRKWPSVG